MSYNGWSNRETWLLSIHGFTESYCQSDFDSVDAMADAMLANFDNMLEPILEHGGCMTPLVRDLLAGINKIDFTQLAESIWEDE